MATPLSATLLIAKRLRVAGLIHTNPPPLKRCLHLIPRAFRDPHLWMQLLELSEECLRALSVASEALVSDEREVGARGGLHLSLLHRLELGHRRLPIAIEQMEHDPVMVRVGIRCNPIVVHLVNEATSGGDLLRLAARMEECIERVHVRSQVHRLELRPCGERAVEVTDETARVDHNIHRGERYALAILLPLFELIVGVVDRRNVVRETLCQPRRRRRREARGRADARAAVDGVRLLLGAVVVDVVFDGCCDGECLRVLPRLEHREDDSHLLKRSEHNSSLEGHIIDHEHSIRLSARLGIAEHEGDDLLWGVARIEAHDPLEAVHLALEVPPPHKVLHHPLVREVIGSPPVAFHLFEHIEGEIVLGRLEAAVDVPEERVARRHHILGAHLLNEFRRAHKVARCRKDAHELVIHLDGRRDLARKEIVVEGPRLGLLLLETLEHRHVGGRIRGEVWMHRTDSIECRARLSYILPLDLGFQERVQHREVDSRVARERLEELEHDLVLVQRQSLLHLKLDILGGHGGGGGVVRDSLRRGPRLVGVRLGAGAVSSARAVSIADGGGGLGEFCARCLATHRLRRAALAVCWARAQPAHRRALQRRRREDRQLRLRCAEMHAARR